MVFERSRQFFVVCEPYVCQCQSVLAVRGYSLDPSENPQINHFDLGVVHLACSNEPFMVFHCLHFT